MTKSEIRCIHRHTIDEHPSCFAKGLIKLPDDLTDRQWERITGIPWYQFPGYRIGYFDIEVDNLKADFGTVLSWAIKEKGGGTAYDVITREDIFENPASPDERITKSFVEEMYKYQIIVGYYSTKMDLPYMRTKALRYRLDFPSYGDVYHWDIYYTVRNKLQLSRNSLDNACDYLGIEGKTPLDKNIWRVAKYGDPDALKEVLIHNIGDVEILEELHDRLDFTRKWIRKSI